MSLSSFFSCKSLLDFPDCDGELSVHPPIHKSSSKDSHANSRNRQSSTRSDSESDLLSTRTSVISLTSRRCHSDLTAKLCFECSEMSSLCDLHRNSSSCTDSVVTSDPGSPVVVVTLSSPSPSEGQSSTEEKSAQVERRPRSYRQPGCASARQLSYYENTDETQAEFLSASQIQSIMNVHKFVDLAKPHYERCSPGQPRIFGCNVNCLEVHHGGRLLPVFIENTLIYLLRYGIDCVGIFRRSGVRSRISFLRKRLEQVFGEQSPPSTATAHPTPANAGRRNSSFNPYDDDCCVFDLADLIKSWLRELKPAPLVSKQLIAAFIRLKAEGRLNELSYYIIAYLTDPQRDLLLIFIRFLNQFARNAHQNQMNAHNLAICLAPSVCEYSALIPTGSANISFESQSQTLNLALKDLPPDQSAGPSSSAPPSPSLKPKTTSHVKSPPAGRPPRPRQSTSKLTVQRFALNEAETLVNAQHCLEYLIVNYERVSMLSPAVVSSSAAQLLTGSSYRLLNDGNLLPSAHQLRIQIPAPPVNILNRILYQRNLFDSTIVEWRILESNERKREDVLEYQAQKSHFLPCKTFRIRRSWIFCRLPPEEMSNESCSFSSTSTTASSSCTSPTSSSSSLSPPSSTARLFDSNFPLSSSTFYTSLEMAFNSSSARPLSGLVNRSAPFKLLDDVNCKDHSVLLKEEGTLYNVTYAIRPTSDHKASQLTASVAIDLRGRSFYWYKNIFPDLINGQLQTLRRTFVLDTV